MKKMTLEEAQKELREYRSEVGSNTTAGLEVGIYKDKYGYTVATHYHAENFMEGDVVFIC